MKILLVLFFIVAITACDNRSKNRKAADEIASKLPEPTGMNAGKANYTVYVPAGWTTKHRTEYGVDYYFLNAPQTKDDPNTNINLVTEDMRGLDLEDYRTKTIEAIKNAIPSASILEQGDIFSNALKGVWYSYTMSPQGIEATLIGYIFPQNGIAYIITAGTQTKDASRYRSTFDSVARSIKFYE